MGGEVKMNNRFMGARGKALETKIGSGTLHTIEQNLIGAINEILEVGVVIANWSVSKDRAL